MWPRGQAEIRSWMRGPGAGCRGSRLVPVQPCASPAFAQWRPDGNGRFEPWSIHMLELRDGRIVGLTFFLDTEKLAGRARAALGWRIIAVGAVCVLLGGIVELLG